MLRVSCKVSEARRSTDEYDQELPQSHTADQPKAMCGRAKYHNHTLQTNPRHCMEESNTTITHCRPTHGIVWKSQIPQSHTANQPTALYGRVKYHNHTLQTYPRHCMEESNTTITHCRPTHGIVWKSQIQQSHTANQPTALYGRVKYHNYTLQTNPWHCVEEPKYHKHTLQTNPRHCMEESNTTITHCRLTHGIVWKSQIPQSHTADQPMALCGRAEIPQSHTAYQPKQLCGRAKYHNHTLQTNPRHCMEEPNTTITH